MSPVHKRRKTNDGAHNGKTERDQQDFLHGFALQWNTLVLVQKKMSASIGDAPTMVPGTHAAPG